MNELNTAPTGALDVLAAEARLLTQSIFTGWLRLGGVLIQAKELVRYGEWGEWLAVNAPVGERTAQNMMAAYRRFGDKPAFFAVEGSKLTALLALPEGAEDDFAEQNKLDEMSARAVQEAVRVAKAEAVREIQAAQQRAAEAEARCLKLESTDAQLSNEVRNDIEKKATRIAKLEQEVARVADGAKQSMADKNALLEEVAGYKALASVKDKLLADAEEAAQAAQNSYLALLSQTARGDSGRESDPKLSDAAFADATRIFLGACGVMAYMGREFAEMDAGRRQAFDQYLKMLEQFVCQARQALETWTGEVIEA